MNTIINKHKKGTPTVFIECTQNKIWIHMKIQPKNVRLVNHFRKGEKKRAQIYCQQINTFGPFPCQLFPFIVCNVHIAVDWVWKCLNKKNIFQIGLIFHILSNTIGKLVCLNPINCFATYIWQFRWIRADLIYSEKNRCYSYCMHVCVCEVVPFVLIYIPCCMRFSICSYHKIIENNLFSPFCIFTGGKKW